MINLWFLEKGTIHSDKMCPARGKSANRATEHFGGPTEKEGFRVEAKTDSHDPERTYSLALLPSSEPAAARGGGNQPLHPWLMPGRTDADPTQGPGEDGARWGRRKTPKQEGGWEDGHLLEQASLRTGHPQSQHPYGASSKPASIRDILKASIHTGHPQSQHPYGASSKPASIWHLSSILERQVESFSAPPPLSTPPSLNAVIPVGSLWPEPVHERGRLNLQLSSGCTSPRATGVAVRRAWLGGSQVPLDLHFPTYGKGLQGGG